MESCWLCCVVGGISAILQLCGESCFIQPLKMLYFAWAAKLWGVICMCRADIVTGILLLAPLLQAMQPCTQASPKGRSSAATTAIAAELPHEVDIMWR